MENKSHKLSNDNTSNWQGKNEKEEMVEEKEWMDDNCQVGGDYAAHSKIPITHLQGDIDREIKLKFQTEKIFRNNFTKQ